MPTPSALPVNPYVIAVTIIPTPVGFAGASINNLAILTKDVPLNGAITQNNPGVYVSSAAVLADWGPGSEIYEQAQEIFDQPQNPTGAEGVVIGYPMGMDQTLAAAMNDLASRQFFGGYLVAGYTPSPYEVVTAAKASQSIFGVGAFFFYGSNLVTDLIFASGATGTATETAGAITAVAVTAGGTGYQANTSVTVIDADNGPGTGAVVTATVAGGAITGLTIVTPGTGYVSPTLVFTSSPLATFNNLGLTNARGFYYNEEATAVGARIAAAGDAGARLAVDFSQPGSAANRQLKPIVGIDGDSTVTPAVLGQPSDGDSSPTLYGQGVNSYPNFVNAGGSASLPGVFETFANGGFFDTLYGLKALALDIQTAGFNAIRQAPTKIPQTEAGVSQLLAVFTSVLNKYVSAGLIAPGVWQPPYPGFGTPQALLRNIAQSGFYLYSVPVAAQLEAQRQTRVAPPISIAVKLAGAINSADVVITFQP